MRVTRTYVHRSANPPLDVLFSRSLPDIWSHWSKLCLFSSVAQNRKLPTPPPLPFSMLLWLFQLRRVDSSVCIPSWWKLSKSISKWLPGGANAAKTCNDKTMTSTGFSAAYPISINMEGRKVRKRSWKAWVHTYLQRNYILYITY
jgi:hypothetical protein